MQKKSIDAQVDHEMRRIPWDEVLGNSILAIEPDGAAEIDAMLHQQNMMAAAAADMRQECLRYLQAGSAEHAAIMAINPHQIANQAASRIHSESLTKEPAC